eukprot:scaffold49236_cov15-Tisochrysis_lutea.AAC.1
MAPAYHCPAFGRTVHDLVFSFFLPMGCSQARQDQGLQLWLLPITPPPHLAPPPCPRHAVA